MKDLTIIKIGGSVLTEKKGSGNLRRRLIKKIAKYLKPVSGKQGMIVVLGGGAKVHAAAKKYGLKLGARSKRQILGALKTHLLAKQMQMDVSEILSNYLPVVPLQTNNFFFADRRDAVRLENASYLTELLKKNLIPVFYGDMIYHPTKNFVIL